MTVCCAAENCQEHFYSRSRHLSWDRYAPDEKEKGTCTQRNMCKRAYTSVRSSDLFPSTPTNTHAQIQAGVCARSHHMLRHTLAHVYAHALASVQVSQIRTHLRTLHADIQNFVHVLILENCDLSTMSARKDTRDFPLLFGSLIHPFI